MIAEMGLIRIGYFRHPPKGSASDEPQETAVWWTTPQHHPDAHYHNLTQEVYPMLFLL